MAPRIESLSSHRVTSHQSIYVNGTGFRDVVGVQVGPDWADSFVVDGESTITITLPEMAGGSTNWVVVHTRDGDASPCEGDAQLLTVEAVDDVPVGPLRIDSLTPEAITLGRADPYWIIGSGLSRASSVTIASSGCRFEAYDDSRMVFYLPEHVNGATDGAVIELAVVSPRDTATMVVNCTVPPDLPPSGAEAGPPHLTGVRPDHLGSDGGQIVVEGLSLQHVVTVSVGDVACSVESTGYREVTATVPGLADYVGQSLAVTVTDGTYASGETDILVTVTS
jgi:hypothetical protein